MTAPNCCDTPVVTEQSRANEGSHVEIYSECLTCGAKWKDVFTHSYSTRPDD